MDRIHYAGHSIVTGTAIARGLLDYAQALTAVVASASVQVPTLRSDGSLGISQFLIGPASQLLSDTESGASEEIIDEDLVMWMRHEAGLLRGTVEASSITEGPGFGSDRDWDFDR